MSRAKYYKKSGHENERQVSVNNRRIQVKLKAPSELETLRSNQQQTSQPPTIIVDDGALESVALQHGEQLQGSLLA